MRTKQDIKEERTVITIWLISCVIALLYCAYVDKELILLGAIH